MPYEALLTLGDAGEALKQLWALLSEGDGVQTLLRLAQVRYVEHDFGDPFVLAPVVEVAFCGKRNLGTRRRGSRESAQQQLATLVLAWLRGLARAGRGPDQLRQRVRDTILEQEPPDYDKFAVEALSTLDPDLDDAAEAWLRSVAQDHPADLHPAVESTAVAISLPMVKPDLLLDLAEAYYIEKPDNRRRSGRDVLDDGIRDFQHGLGFGYGVPQAAWYYGPFFRLLNATPLRTIAFINRMLNHAALYRVTDTFPRNPEPTWEEYEGLILELPEATGPRHYVGDAHVWSWYRGTSVGPYACMSALLALEKFTDYLLETAGLQASTIVDLLLKDCHNLAVPGMVVGFLTRHLDEADALLDPFLAEVDVWHLESSRMSGEHSFRARDADADKLFGQDKRRYTPHETVSTMVINARLRGDDHRLEQLELVGSRLVESARRKAEGVDDPGDYVAMVQGWGAEFRIDSYDAKAVDNGVVIQFERPAESEEALAPRSEELATVGVLYGLRNRYALANEHPETRPTEHLLEDIATARGIETSGPPANFLWPENPIVAVAAAAVRAQVMGAVEVDPSDLAWAAEMVLLGAENPHIDSMSYHSSLFSMGADRAAAIAVPLLLLSQCDDLLLDAERLQGALHALASSLYDEVRTAFAKGCAPVWDAPCDLDEAGTCHRHYPAWVATAQSLSDCQLGPWDFEAQRRMPKALEPPYAETLHGVPDDDLMVNRLRMPIVCVAGASQTACLSEATARPSEPLWDAHRRGLDHWWREGYDHLDHRHHEPIARLFIDDALQGERRALEAHLWTFASNPHALQVFMDGLAKVFTYDDARRASLATVWVPSLATVLDAIGDGADIHADRGSWSEWAIASLLPTPQADVSDLDIDATLNRCRETWADPDAFAHLIDRWVGIAKGQPRAADAVAQLARTAPVSWQCTTGLDWLEAVMDGRHAEFSNRLSYVVTWQGDLRESGAVTGPVVAQFHRIVDGLAAGGDVRAVSLQLLDE